jgi:hypothetical protein
MAFENYQDMRVGDVIECYRVETIQRSCKSKSSGRVEVRRDVMFASLIPA